MVQLFQDGNLLIDSLQGPFGLRRTLGDCALCCQLTWETCLPHQLLLGQHLHGLRKRKSEREPERQVGGR
uniref:Uncharacterized protein n=1 Tax=Myripristis murdjan TaxID=586833 RepID=A0A667ZQM5_9TELE